eukprot:2238070-Pleurochrysis_carterae.AAC.2
MLPCQVKRKSNPPTGLDLAEHVSTCSLKVEVMNSDIMGSLDSQVARRSAKARTECAFVSTRVDLHI